MNDLEHMGDPHKHVVIALMKPANLQPLSDLAILFIKLFSKGVISSKGDWLEPHISGGSDAGKVTVQQRDIKLIMSCRGEFSLYDPEEDWIWKPVSISQDIESRRYKIHTYEYLGR